MSTMGIELREITPDNLEDCIRLQPADDQKTFMSPIVYSIAESKVSPEEVPLAMYDDDELVGFIMYGVSPTDGNYWILRLLVDKRYQQRGYARGAIKEVLRRLSERPDCTDVRVSYEPGNTVGAHLYESLGFRPTGEVLFGEVVAILSIHPMPPGDIASSAEQGAAS
jgi:diamine N-acetyltransferase